MERLSKMFDCFFNSESRFPQVTTFSSLTEQSAYFEHARNQGSQMRSWTVWHAAWMASTKEYERKASEFLDWHTYENKEPIPQEFKDWINAKFMEGKGDKPVNYLEAWKAGCCHARMELQENIYD